MQKTKQIVSFTDFHFQKQKLSFSRSEVKSTGAIGNRGEEGTYTVDA